MVDDWSLCARRSVNVAVPLLLLVGAWEGEGEPRD